MKKFYVFCLFVLLLNLSTYSIAFSQGLAFKGNEELIDKRTSYLVFKEPVVFDSQLQIDFDISIGEPSRVGYIVRIKSDEKKIFNLFLNHQDDNLIYKLNDEGKSTLIDVSIDLKKEHSTWHHISICFDLEEDALCFAVNGRQSIAKNIGLFTHIKPTIQFGRSDYLIDVPSFSIKNLIVKDRKKEFCFLLKESKGEWVHDQNGTPRGKVLNPVWLINDAYYWKLRASFASNTISGANYNHTTQEVYYFNQDTIHTYNLHSGKSNSKEYSNKCPLEFNLGTSFIDERGRLYVYECISSFKTASTIASLDSSNNIWSSVSTEKIPALFHHHNGYYDLKNKRYTLFGGFGDMRYSNQFYQYDMKTDKWDTIIFEDNHIPPRYFSSMGYSEKQNKLYLFGGMGNESGDQTVGRRYYYDLYQIDLENKQIVKLWEIPWAKDYVVPVRQMIIPNDTCFYTLCYPEHFSNSYLQLYKFSIADGRYEIVGDSIPIRSEKIKTNANLYYNKQREELYALIQEFENDDIASQLKVYSLSYSPIGLNELTLSNSSFKNYTGLYCFLFLSVALICICLVVRNNKKQKSAPKQLLHNELEKQEQLLWTKFENKPNSIYLFGEFSVRDRQNREIGYMFSSKLKNVFLLILQYSFEKGISSQLMTDLLWPGKPEDKTKNIRGVTINNLRKLLSELDGIQLVYEKGFFKIVFTDECYCDCLQFFRFFSNLNSETNNTELFQILSRGKFLASIENPLLDSFKELVESKIEPVLNLMMEYYFSYEKYHTVIQLSDALFKIDPVNEQAICYCVRSMIRLKMFGEAKKRYLHFAAEYKEVMGEKFAKSFTDISATDYSAE